MNLAMKALRKFQVAPKNLGALFIICSMLTGIFIGCDDDEMSLTPSIHLEVFDPDTSGSTQTLDLNTMGDFPGPGDMLLSEHHVYHVSSQQYMGRTITRIQFINATPAGDLFFLLDCTLSLSDGSFHFTGGAAFSALTGAGADFPIVNGTGTYKGKSGLVHIKAGNLGPLGSGFFITADLD